MKVLFHYSAGPALTAQLSALSGLEVAFCPESDDACLAALLPTTEVIWHVLKPITAAHIAAAPRLKLIQKIGVGVNTIDLAAAKARDIAVCNLPGTNSRAVAEMTLLLMLGALRQMGRFERATRNGTGWSQDPSVQDSLFELGGRTVGLVGYGEVPRILAPALVALGCRVLYTARAPKPGAAGEWRSLDALLAESDVVSLHIPQTSETTNLINAAALARMKRGSVLVNTARGGLVDEAALLAALRSGHLAGAGLDVFAQEPVAPDNPLLTMPNVFVAPHIAWLTTGTFDRSFSIAADNCRRLAAGEALLNRVV